MRSERIRLKRGEIVNRTQVDERVGQVLDEVVADRCDIHVEMMDLNDYALIVETKHERVCYHFLTPRARITLVESWRNRVNRRQEAAVRRENRKRHRLSPSGARTT